MAPAFLDERRAHLFIGTGRSVIVSDEEGHGQCLCINQQDISLYRRGSREIMKRDTAKKCPVCKWALDGAGRRRGDRGDTLPPSA
jgi:hypothetical protein